MNLNWWCPPPLDCHSINLLSQWLPHNSVAITIGTNSFAAIDHWYTLSGHCSWSHPCPTPKWGICPTSGLPPSEFTTMLIPFQSSRKRCHHIRSEHQLGSFYTPKAVETFCTRMSFLDTPSCTHVRVIEGLLLNKTALGWRVFSAILLQGP